MLLLECLLGLIRFLLGAALFSFMNVVAWRLPRNMDPLKGRSICPRCGRTLDAPDLVPVFSWLFLRGRCRHCGAHIPARYLLVEVLGGVLALGCTRQYGAALALPDGLFGMSWAALLALAVCGILLSIALIDAETQTIPDRLNFALAVCGVAGTALSPAGWRGHIIGAVCVSVPMFLLCLAIDGAFGGGDIKLMAAAGLFLGWQNTLLAMFFGILGGGVYCAGTLELSGTTSITGNRAQDAQDNLWLDETAALKIGDLGLDKQAHIGVSGAAEQTILTGYADDFSENFTSDDLTLTISTARENGFTELTLQEAVYTLTLDPGEGSEPVTLEAEQGKSLHELNVQAPERENMTFDGWYTEEGDCVDAEAPLHLTGDTTLSARWTQAEPQSAEAALLTYDPDAPITKQEAAKTLYQMARQLGLDTEAGQEVDLTQFEDADEISEDAADAVRWAYAADLLTEKDGKLHVADELTRKELTRMLEDFLDLI